MLLCKEDNYVYSWLARLQENQINSDVLLLVFKGYFRNDKNINIKLNTVKEKITKELTAQKIFHYEILEIENIASLKVDTSTILIGYEGMDRKLLQDIDFQIRFCYCRNFNRKTLLPTVHKETTQDKDIDNSLCIIKKRNPVEIISDCNIIELEDYLYSLFARKNITIFYPTVCEPWIRNDIKVLSTKKVLTARLAKIIYAVSTLNFNVSDTKIGLFYKNVFGTKSKPMRLKLYGNRVFKVYCIDDLLKKQINEVKE